MMIKQWLVLLSAQLLFIGGLTAQQNTQPVVRQIRVDAQLRAMNNTTFPFLQPLKNKPFNRQRLETALQQLQNYWHERGYLFVQIDEGRLQFAQDSSVIDIIIEGRRGRQVIIGRITIQSDSLQAQQYRRLLTVGQEDVYNRQRIESDLQQMLQRAAENGYPLARAAVDEIRFQKQGDELAAQIKISVHEGRRIYIKDIIIEGNDYTKDHVILRAVNLQKGQQFRLNEIRQIPRKLNRLGIFKAVRQPTIVLSEAPDSIFVRLEVQEGNATTFDGVVGYVPQRKGRFNTGGYFTGLIDIALNNLFGTARHFRMHWQKPDQFSEDFHIAYTEPWVLGYPVDAGLRLDRTVRDTTFIEWQTQFNTRIRLWRDLSILGSVQRRVVIPDSLASRQQGLLQSNTIDLQIGLEYDTRDYPPNPREGIYYNSSYSYGFKEITGPSYLIKQDSLQTDVLLQTIHLQFNFYQHLWANQVLAVGINGKQIKGDLLQVSDYFWFGGSRSLRGYREDQFQGKDVVWANVEYGFILNRDSRAFLFNDWGYYRLPLDDGEKSETLTGYGFGIRFQTAVGILGVDYGLARGDSFGQGKIHFGIISRF
ncbi:MAG: BamA/TamA family outer membrane protein [Caldithrix sp.]|nr:BamA/TamA family outer membrane protein [Caldithrix sp.]